MRHALPTLIALTAVGLCGRAIVGCATSADNAPGGGDDAGTPADQPSVPVAASDAAGSDARDDANATIDASPPCSPDGWCMTELPGAAIAEAEALDPAFIPMDLRDVWVTKGHDAWAVASEGYVLHWERGAWSFVFNAKAPLSTVWASGRSDVWIGGEGGVVFHGLDKAGSMAFEKVELGTTENVVRLRGSSSSDVLAITNDGIYRSTGTAFAEIPFPNAIPQHGAQRIWTMWGSDADTWIAAREFSNCSRFDPSCNYQDRTVLLRWKGVDAGAADDPSSSFDRIQLDLTCAPPACAITPGAASADGSHVFALTQRSGLPGKPGVRNLIHVAPPEDAGVSDGGAIQVDGGYAWTKEDQTAAGCGTGCVMEGLLTPSAKDVWFVASPPTVRHWDGQGWAVARVAPAGGAPLARPLHAITGVVDPGGKSDMWIVGTNLALHRSESP